MEPASITIRSLDTLAGIEPPQAAQLSIQLLKSAIYRCGEVAVQTAAMDWVHSEAQRKRAEGQDPFTLLTTHTLPKATAFILDQLRPGPVTHPAKPALTATRSFYSSGARASAQSVSSCTQDWAGSLRHESHSRPSPMTSGASFTGRVNEVVHRPGIASPTGAALATPTSTGPTSTPRQVTQGRKASKPAKRADATNIAAILR